MRILALDTATSACSVALWCDGAVRARRFAPMERGQAEALVPMLGAVLADAGCAFAELDLLAVTVGPGTFTGLRIGLAAARGLALAAALPCLGVTTLEAVADGVGPEERAGAALLVVLDAKRRDVYAQLFSAGLEPLGEARAVLPSGLAETLPAGPLVVAGDAAHSAAEALARGRARGRSQHRAGGPRCHPRRRHRGPPLAPRHAPVAAGAALSAPARRHAAHWPLSARRPLSPHALRMRRRCTEWGGAAGSSRSSDSTSWPWSRTERGTLSRGSAPPSRTSATSPRAMRSMSSLVRTKVSGQTSWVMSRK